MTTAPEVDQLRAINTATLVLGIQPISTSLIAAGGANGGNTLGLQAVNQTWLVLDFGWAEAKDDAKAHRLMKSLRKRIEQVSVNAGQYGEYVFMNDASWDQDVIGHYGVESVRRLRAVAELYDPTGVFQRLVPGGFKLND
jgi:hypothetical protein